MTSTREISWFETGWPAGVAAETSFVVLAAAALLGVAFIFFSYRFTLVGLSPVRRVTLCTLRFAGWLLLLGILAAPMRIERQFEAPAGARRSAVLVDRSDSMTAADNRRQRRLDDALLKWRRAEAAARQTFAGIDSFAFAQGVTPVALASAPAELPTTRTELYAAVQAVLDRAPDRGWGSVVVLTDGLDTTGVSAEEAQRTIIRSALAKSTPLFFVIGRNRSVQQPYLRLRDLKIPTRTTPKSTISVEAVFESFQTVESTVPVQLTVNGENLPVGSIALQPGEHVVRWTANVPVESPGTLALELHAGGEAARAEVAVDAVRNSRRVLYHVGTLDWGYRYLARMLRQNDALTVTPVFALPQAGVVLPAETLLALPATREELERFDVMILADTRVEQLPASQQVLLARWVADGGVLFLMLSGDEATHGFAGSELEKVLPAVFEPVPTAPVGPPAAAAGATGVRLTPFAWEDAPVVREIFAPGAEAGQAVVTPRFASAARIARLKPGAEVLARHPTALEADGNGRVIFAMQRFGRGRSVLLLTDSLWRWKLNSRSDDHGPELFWTNLLLWLTRNRDSGLFFDRPPVRAQPGNEVAFRVTGLSAERVEVVAILGPQRLDVAALPAGDGTREFKWRAPSAGLWQLEAKSASGAITRTWVSVEAPAGAAVDLVGTPPNEALLRSLAAKTGGAVLEDVPAAWRPTVRAKPQLRSEKKEPLWHRGWLLGVLLGVYGLELILRRRWQLL